MLDWLRKDVASDTDSELGLDLSCCLDSASSPNESNSSNILLPDQVHPSGGSGSSSGGGSSAVSGQMMPPVAATTTVTTETAAGTTTRSSSTGSTTSSGVSSDLHSLVSPEPTEETDEHQHHSHHNHRHHSQRLSSESPPQLPPRRDIGGVGGRAQLMLLPSGGKTVKYKDDISEDSNSDTGLSSLNSSSEADQFTLDTLV
jgi:hypothetical protein